MTELSPVAQAVVDAYRASWQDEPLKQDVKCLAAALEQLIELVPTRNKPSYQDTFAYGVWWGQNDLKLDLLTLISELEKHQ
jgi:hypothetical protein